MRKFPFLFCHTSYIHAPAPLREQCHFRELLAGEAVQQPRNIPEALQRLIATAPETALSLHMKGRENMRETAVESEGKGRLCCLRQYDYKEVLKASMQLVSASSQWSG